MERGFTNRGVCFPFLLPGRDHLVSLGDLGQSAFMDHDLTFRIVLKSPPAGVDFGLQKGRGSDYETIQRQRSKGEDLRFEFTVGVKAGPKDQLPTLLGPFVQGPPGERFVYLDIGTYAGQRNTCWSRRLKVPLSGITWDLLERLNDSRAVLEARVPGTGRDGGPNCATVKPFDGWRLAEGGSN
jgi:hypothetical protein